MAQSFEHPGHFRRRRPAFDRYPNNQGTQYTFPKKLSGSTTKYYVNNLFEVEDASGTIKKTKYFFAGNTRVAMVEGSDVNVSYFHQDHLGSSSVTTDNAGNLISSVEYLPYGSERSKTGTEVSSYKFTDQEEDSETNLYNYDARLYDPLTGMFTMADTIVPDYTNQRCQGSELSGIRIKDASRGIAAFEISGDNLELLDREYEGVK